MIPASNHTSELRATSWIALGMLTMVCACAGPQSTPDPPAFKDGDIAPETLIAVVGETARIQTFTADSDVVVDLEVMVARGVDTGDEPLFVEVRNLSLNRRYGHGKISAFEKEPFVPTWRSVEWVERPVLERDQSYTLVFTTDAQDPDWRLAVGLGTYQYGEFSHFKKITGYGGFSRVNKIDFDAGFRIRFADTVTQSELATLDEPLTPYPLKRLLERGDSWGERYYFPIDGYVRNSTSALPRREKRLLPHCVGSRCFDHTSTLLGTPEERAERARRATRSSGEAPVESLSFETGALGVSCRDVCRGHGFIECSGTRNLPSCDSVVSASPKRDDATCLCGREVLPREISDDARVVEKRVHTFFELDDRDRPQLKSGRVAGGLTCAQTCEVLGPESCEGHKDCPREVTPNFSKCPPCMNLTMSEQAEAFSDLSTPVGDKLVTTYGGELRVIDLERNASQAYPLEPGIDLDMKVYAVGRFAVWSRAKSSRYVGRHRYAEGESARFVALDTQSGDVHSVSIDVREPALLCRAAAHKRSLEGRGSLAIFCFEEAATSIYPITGARRLKAPQTSDKKVQSWDGRTAVVSSSMGRLGVWSVGNSEWSIKRPRDRVENVILSSRSVEKLKVLFANTPDHPNIIEGHYYGHDSPVVWRFDPAKEVLEGWGLPRSKDVTISEDLIRVGSYVLDIEDDVFKHVPASILHAVGPFGFIEASQCPEQLRCRGLETPLDDFAVLNLNVDDYETTHAREISEINPDDFIGPNTFYSQ